MTTATATITLQETRLMLERAKLFATRWEDRPVLHSMHLIIVDGHVRAEATDGFALMVHTIDAHNAKGNAEALIDLDDVGAMLKALPRVTKNTAQADVVISIDGSYAGSISIGEFECVGKTGTFPNLGRLVPRTADDPTNQFGIAGEMLERVGKLARIGHGSGAVCMHIPDEAKQPMVFTVRDSDRSRAVAVVMPMFIDLFTLSTLVEEVLV